MPSMDRASGIVHAHNVFSSTPKEYREEGNLRILLACACVKHTRSRIQSSDATAGPGGQAHTRVASCVPPAADRAPLRPPPPGACASLSHARLEGKLVCCAAELMPLLPSPLLSSPLLSSPLFSQPAGRSGADLDSGVRQREPRAGAGAQGHRLRSTQQLLRWLQQQQEF